MEQTASSFLLLSTKNKKQTINIYIVYKNIIYAYIYNSIDGHLYVQNLQAIFCQELQRDSSLLMLLILTL